MAPVKIIGIAGSLRRASYNRAALRAAATLLPDEATLDTFELDGIPGFNQDDEGNPPARVVELKRSIRAADAVLIVTPEYNGGYPAALKNVIDLLTGDWNRKPVALAPVSNGAFGGTQVTTSLLFSLWKIKAWVVPQPMQVPNVAKNFSEDGTPEDPEAWARRSSALIQELAWAAEFAPLIRERANV